MSPHRASARPLPVEPGSSSAPSGSEPEAELEDSRNRGSTVWDNFRPDRDGQSPTALLRLVNDAIKLVWRVAPREFTVAALFQVLAAIALMGQLLLARHVLALVTPEGRHGFQFASVLPSVAALVGVAAILAFSSTVQQDVTHLVGELVGRRASSDVASVAASVDLDAFEQPEFYDRLQRARVNAELRNVTAASSLLGLINSMLGTLGIGVALIAVQPALVPAILVAAVPAWMINSRNSRRLHAFLTAVTPVDRMRTYLLDALTTREFAKEIRAFDVGPLLRTRHDRLYSKRITALRGLLWTQIRRALVGDLLGSLITGAALALLLWRVSSGHASLASAGTAVFAILLMAQRLRTAVVAAGRLFEASLFLEDANSFIKLKPKAESRRPAGVPPSEFERLTVENVSFTYPGASRSSLRNVSLDMRAGEVVALVGTNGSGKTTLAKLLAGLHAPSSGRILWDDVDIATCDPVLLRRSVALIFQDFARWALPARDNIGIGRSETIDDEERILGAARRSRADAFISRLPDGYDTVLSRMFAGGRDLSIGQWQLVALARTFFRDAPFVIMDEPTAALDPLAEYRMFTTVREALRGRTVLFISHRFSSVRMADRIFVLNDGEVTEQGTHAELMRRRGSYARMFSVQASAYLDIGVVR